MLSICGVGIVVWLRHEHKLRIRLDPEIRDILTKLLDSLRHPGADRRFQPLPQQK